MIFIVAFSLAVLALFAFSFVISSVWEKEKRAALIGDVAFLILVGGEIGLFALRAVGFSQSTLGFLLLLVGLVIPVAALLLLMMISFMARSPSPHPLRNGPYILEGWCIIR